MLTRWLLDGAIWGSPSLVSLCSSSSLSKEVSAAPAVVAATCWGHSGQKWAWMVKMSRWYP